MTPVDTVDPDASKLENLNPKGSKPSGTVVNIIARGVQLATSRLMLSVGAQALVSGFHFALNLLLLRMVTPYEYGIFAFAFVLAMFASAINNALISTPLTVYTPVIKDQTERKVQEAMFSTLNLLLFGVLILCGAGYSLWAGLATPISVGVTAFVAVYSARHYSRSAGYARLRPLVTATGDSVYVGAGMLIVLTLVMTRDELPISDVLLALAAANLVAMIVERWRLSDGSRRWFTLSRINTYGAVWVQSRWALAGSLTTLFLAQAHSVIITSTHGPNAYAPLAAGFVLFGPVRVALLTWQNMVKPEMAVALSESRHAEVRKQIKVTTLLMVGAVLCMGLFLWVAWPWIHRFLYAEQYADKPMGFIVCVWSIITLFAASYNAPAAALQAMRDFRILAIASIYGAVLSGLLVSAILYYFQPEITLFGILAAEAFMAVYLTYTLYTRLHAET